MEPAAVIVEILNDDGTMARRPELEIFARQHGLKIGTIAELIRYRIEKEPSVERIVERQIETEFGPFTMYYYEDHVHRTVHIALLRGVLDGSRVPLVRVHIRDTLRDSIGVSDKILGWPLRSAMQRIAQEGQGIIILLRPEETPRDLIDVLQVLDSGGQAALPKSAAVRVLRTYGIGAQILRDLGVTQMRVLSAPRQILGLSGFGLEVTEYVDG
jgi:3,4-dihydroxy 2-butanone 4-phosphate synthase/GTP cyclohydrolase II